MVADASAAIYLDDASAPQIAVDPKDASTVLATAPLRVDLTGGFTDVAPFSSMVDSLHINAAFDLSVKVVCKVRHDRRFQAGFGRDGGKAATSDGRHRFLEAVRAGTAEFTQEHGLNLTINSEAPAGSGLGSSGSILVAAIAGCASLAGVSLTPTALARRAIDAASAAGIVGGQQDEFAAAHGSLRSYSFDRDGSAAVRSVESPQTLRYLEESLLMVQMAANGRKADIVADVVRAVRSSDQETIRTLHHLQELAHKLWAVLRDERFDLFPDCLRQIRETQCALHPRLCCPTAAAALETAREQIPELEYKILGGGGAGSCMLVHVPTASRAMAAALLRKRAQRVWDLKIQPDGVRTGLVADAPAIGQSS
jgi:D-glycero-alpha-D-manno-heptose-7-phosphate kinase